MPKHLVCRIGTFVSTHTIKWKVKALRWTYVGEEFERTISFENGTAEDEAMRSMLKICYVGEEFERTISFENGTA